MIPPPGNSASLPPLVDLPEFQGPMELLLDEVRRQNVAIENLAMAPVVARFLAYVSAAAERNLNLDIEWLHMAATLIYWKSRALLPRDVSQGPQKDPVREELIQQLLAYRKQAAGELGRRRAVEESRFTRHTNPGTEESAPPGFRSLWDLIQEARDLARWVEQNRDHRRCWRQSCEIGPEETTVSEMMDYLREQLTVGGGMVDGLGLLESQSSAWRRSCLFLGMLEMASGGRIELQQDQPFGSIRIIDCAGG